ncbi:chromosome partitioning protein ParA [Vibrio metschnikovii]|nr:chromosome partitioning protein ParA [Vibrio metschnikovii]EKO3722536.1 chromosome partitioning protein ParA [Vibrio metschnikovii]EKO3881181.1 chromosome partitioning protein ParA [Vibrio metschnikovii]
MKKIIILSLIILLVGCNQSESTTTKELPNQSVDLVIEKDEKLVMELISQPTIDAQLQLLYKKYVHLLNRDDTLLGVDENESGIRDDIEAFIDALEVTEPIRNVIKQGARYSQKNLYHDFTDNTRDNYSIARRIAGDFDKVMSCQKYLGMDINDRLNIGKTLQALTYNTKNRTLAYLKYNRILSGSSFVLLPAEEENCE